MECTSMRGYLVALAFMFLSLTAKASGGGGHEAAAKKPDAHGEPAKKGGEHGGDEAEAAKSKFIGPKREYNPGKVMAFPSFSAQVLGETTKLNFKPERGRAVMIFFVASWCEPCQVLMMEFKQLARKYANTNTDIYFVFSHDTKDDASGFVKEYQLPQKSLMANTDILTVFKNPELPSVYIGDRWGYLADRFLKIKKPDIDRIDQSLSQITAL